MTSELKPTINVNDLAHILSENGVCLDGRISVENIASEIEELLHHNTRDTPSADTLAGLVRYGQVMTRIMKVELGEYVLYSEAAAVIGDLTNELYSFRSSFKQQSSWKECAEATKAERDATRDDRFDGLWRFWNSKARELTCENTRLKAELDKLKAQEPVADSLKAEVERLREALMPFANVADLDIGDDEYDDDIFWPISNARYSMAGRLCVGDLRKARTALKGDSNDKG